MNTTIQGIKPRKPKEMEEMTGYFIEYQQGNEKNFGKLYAHLERKCMDYLKYNKKWINSSDYEDIVSTAFIEAIKYKHTFSIEKSQITTWFYRIIDSIIYHNKIESMKEVELVDTFNQKGYRSVMNMIDDNENLIIMKMDMDMEELQKQFN